ncbi:uncharacterized protein MONBRDRAFT_34641 [Monosiga brevicollis MX1]|uniref:Thioredoxin n=1 Tax=Monosiga brevicollis TaxID=81824 RepID=A9VD12_MONBE|nr:uncharacterized protein MONBRDRAFT_34641 [Monosiga brevicollis MX1]EDQ84562.1 predicted protein [Monosiga brevicollis MX1]|eukprot:XP_001750589.1 hypothetical protein [Monosiga brevicollis MX1]
MPAMIQSLAEFKEKIASGVVAIDFTATWCGPCRMIGPKFEAFAEEFTNVKCFKVDVDQASDVATELGISAMPTFHFFKDGEKVDELIGADVNKLKALFQKYN